MKIEFDHIAVAAGTLEAGCAVVESAMAVTLAPGGVHPAMATHNRLLGLGPGEYLEVIAVDPEAPPPGRPRWFDLDSFAGPPRLTNWILRTDDLEAALAAAPAGAGVPMALQRGELRWRMAVPGDGRLPFDGCFPALIEWQGDMHPADRLPDAGCRLTRLDIVHPSAAALSAALSPLFADERVIVTEGPQASIRAAFDTPAGPRVIP